MTKTATTAQITAARKAGLTNVEALAAACSKHDLRFYLGATILAKETKGWNIYGHDRGGVFTLKTGNMVVTQENFPRFLAALAKPGAVSNGVGPMQITYKGHFAIMAKLGLRAWVPAENIDYGVGLIADTYRARKDAGDTTEEAFHYAATLYNLGRWDARWPYGLDAVAKARTWQRLLGTADYENAKPAPKPTGPVVHHSKAYGADYVSWHGGFVTVLDARILDAIQAEVRSWWGELRIMQGGLSKVVPDSALTHAGLGAFDVQTKGTRADGKPRTRADVWRLASVFLRSGMVYFPRGFTADSFQGPSISNVLDGNEHGHVCSRESYSSLHPQAKAQVNEYLKGGDGLMGSRSYTGPATKSERWKTSPYNPANVTADAGLYEVTASELLGLDVDRQQVTEHKRGDTIQVAKRVIRWGRDNAVTPNGILYALQYLTPKDAA